GSDQGIDFISMELLDGKTLREMIPPDGMPLLKAVDFAGQIADGLQRAHSYQVIHGNLTPGNIMVIGGCLIKLLDFGLASSNFPADGVSTASAYMSPEQAQGRPVDSRSDIFSFGVILYEMLSGRRPFCANLPEQGNATFQNPPAPLSGVPAKL